MPDMNTRPECPRLKEGDEVIVYPTSHGRGRIEPVAAVVTDAKRVWLTLTKKADLDEGKRFPHDWLMRRDTQRTDTGTNYNSRFATREQAEYDERLAAVDAVISDAKVRLEGGWIAAERIWTPERRIAPADLIVSLGILDAQS